MRSPRVILICRLPTVGLSWKAASVAFVLAAMVVTSMGCEQEAPKPAIMPMPAADTPEGKLARVMQRLEQALVDAQAAPGSGVISRRECDYRLIQPSENESRYTAEVTIKTRRSLDAGNKLLVKPKPVEEEAIEEEAANISDEESPPAKRPANLNLETLAASKSDDLEVYRLVYENDQWDLPVEPKGAVEKICFQYALGR